MKSQTSVFTIFSMILSVSLAGCGPDGGANAGASLASISSMKAISGGKAPTDLTTAEKNALIAMSLAAEKSSSVGSSSETSMELRSHALSGSSISANETKTQAINESKNCKLSGSYTAKGSATGTGDDNKMDIVFNVDGNFSQCQDDSKSMLDGGPVKVNGGIRLSDKEFSLAFQIAGSPTVKGADDQSVMQSFVVKFSNFGFGFTVSDTVNVDADFKNMKDFLKCSGSVSIGDKTIDCADMFALTLSVN